MSAVDMLLSLDPALAATARPGPDYIMVCCPFHGEKTPSLCISTIKPVFVCYGCKIGGHLSQLLRRAGLSKTLIEQLLPRNESTSYKKKNLAARLMAGEDPFRGKYILDDELLDAYRLAPISLLQAGFKEETLRHFEVGFDTKNLRITYPLRTVYGDLVGISGRDTVDGGSGSRYKIYDSELKERTDFHIPPEYTMKEVKSAVLWHGHIVRPLFFKNHTSDTMIVTEGFKACMHLWQYGYEDVVALVGSLLTEAHAELIARAVPKVLLFLDNNEAGHKGTYQAAQRLLRKGVEVTVATYPDEREQPDDLLPDELDEAIDQKKSIRQWRRDYASQPPLQNQVS